MKTSISTWSFPSDMTLDRQLDLTRDSGFEGFEIDLSEAGPVNLGSTGTELQAVRRQVEARGLQLSGLATGLYWGANPASADAATVEKAGRILQRQIFAASELGIDTILVVPGSVGVDFIPGGEVVPYGDVWERARRFVSNALPQAEKLGVTIGIENVWNKFLTSPREMAEFVDSFGSARVGAWFDAGNSLATGYPEHWISLLGPRIRRIHFKDYRRAVGTTDGFVDLLSGDVNWPGVMSALRATGYDGWVSAEMIPPAPFYKHAPEVLIENTARAMRSILALQRTT